MRAVTLTELGAQPTLREDALEPTPSAGKVLVRGQASSVNAIDNAIAAGMLKDMVPHEFPVTLGRDFAGVVEHVGDGVTSVSAGDEVFGEIPPNAGAWAELIIASEQTLVRKPDRVELATAGAAPAGGHHRNHVRRRARALPGRHRTDRRRHRRRRQHRGPARRRGRATVIAPGLSEDEDYLRAVGVTEIVPRVGDVAAAVRERHPDGVDAILDLVSYAPGTYDAALKDGGRIASTNNAAGDGPGRTNVMHRPSPDILGRIARHLADGALKIPIQDTYDLAQAPQALQAHATGYAWGKLALRVA